MEYSEFKEQFRKYHICGADIIGLATTYDSKCPKCEPASSQWEEECKELFNEGRIIRFSGYWYREQDLVFYQDRPSGFKKVIQVSPLSYKGEE